MSAHSCTDGQTIRKEPGVFQRTFGDRTVTAARVIDLTARHPRFALGSSLRAIILHHLAFITVELDKPISHNHADEEELLGVNVRKNWLRFAKSMGIATFQTEQRPRIWWT